eukprot:3793444-Prymnesium_polylepis.1
MDHETGMVLIAFPTSADLTKREARIFSRDTGDQHTHYRPRPSGTTSAPIAGDASGAHAPTSSDGAGAPAWTS